MAQERQSLTGKRVLITGGTTGIGRATAIEMCKQGARAVIFGRDEQYLQDALDAINGEVYGLSADVSKHDDVLRVFEFVDEKLDGLDILINNAGLGTQSVIDVEYDEWKYILDVNMAGYFDCVQQAVKRMEAGSTLLHVGSVSAVSRDADSDIYSATKAGIQAFCDSLNQKLIEREIRVCLVEPGLTGSDMARESHSPEEQREMIEEMTMLKAEDIADAIIYCCTQPARATVRLLRMAPLKEED